MPNGEVLAELVLEGEQQFQSGMDNAGESIQGVGQDAEDASQGADSLRSKLGELGAEEVGAGLAAVGAGMTAITESTKQLRGDLNQTAVTMGTSEKEARNMANSIASAKFPLQEVSGTMDLLSQKGIKNEKEMKSLSGQYNSLATAVGTDTVQATRTATQAMQAFGDDASDIGSNMDTLTYISKNTSLQFDEIGDVVSDIQPQIDNLGLSMKDVGAYLSAMEDEGIGAQKAQELFAQAAESSEGSTKKLRQELGLSEAQVNQHKTAIDNAEGSTKEYAQASNSTISTMDRLRNKFNEAKLAAGGLIAPVEAAGPAMMGLGGAMTMMSTVASASVVPSLSAVYASLTPLLPIIVPLIAIVGALALAWKTDFMGIQGVTKNVASTIMGWLQSLEERVNRFSSMVRQYLQPYINILRGDALKTAQVWQSKITSILGWMENRFTQFSSTVMGILRLFFGNSEGELTGWVTYFKSQVRSAWSIITTIVDGAVDTLTSTIRLGLAVLRGDWEGAWEIITGYFGRQADRLGDISDDAVDMIKRPFSNLASWGKDAGEGLVEAVAEGIKNKARDAKNAVSGVVSDLRDRLPGSDAKTGPLSDLTASGKAFTTTWADALEGESDTARSAVEGVTGEAADAMADSPSPSLSGGASARSSSGGEQITVDASMEEGAVQFNGITWEDALDKMKGIIDDRLSRIERSIKRKYLRGGGA